jgi:hypothetical protein
VSYAKWLCLGIVAVAGCEAGLSLPGGDGKGGSSVDSSVPDDDPNPYSNPDGGLVRVVDGGVVQIADPNDPSAPKCGASSFEAKKVIVDTVIEVPEEVTEEVTEQVPEEVTEDVTEDVVTVKPTTLYIMFDQSASMASGKWTPAVTALKGFVNDPDSAGLGVALQYFPVSGGQCSTGNVYKTPAVGPVALPGSAKTITDSLAAHSPNGIGTPIEGALRGVTEYCKQFQASKPNEQCVAVLVTDGKPELASGCTEDSAKLAAIAKAANDAGVITFAVGLNGAKFDLLDQIAMQGGAPDCDTNNTHYACDVSSGADQLSVALATIREKVVKTVTTQVTHTVTTTVTHEVTHTVTHTKTVQQVQQSTLPCTWAVPSDNAQSFDQNKVNIRLTNNDMQSTFVRVNSKDECRPEAWYYDDPSNPKNFIACDQTCQEITAATDAKIDILLGCPTITPS